MKLRDLSNALLSTAVSAFVFISFAAVTFAQGPPQAPPPLPPGMTGSNANDPRAHLKPGIFDAGEAAMGIKHLGLLKKPTAFDVGTDPNSPMVAKALTSLGIPADAKIPAELKMSFAPLAFANSDIAF